MERCVLMVWFFITFSGCYTYIPELSEKHAALELIDRGTQKLRDGSFEEAEASFKAAYEVAALPEALDGLGSVATLRGNFDLAEIYFIKAYQGSQFYPNALGNLALIKEKKGDIQSANALYLQAIREDPTNFRIRGNFSAFLSDYTSRGKDEARMELLKAQALVDHPVLDAMLDVNSRKNLNK